MLAVTPESAPCSEQGQEELRYSSCVCCPNSSPGKAAKAGLKIRPFAHMGSARVCLCVQTTLNDLKVFYNLGTAELSPSSGPRTWNIHAAAKGNQWKKPSGGAKLLTENGLCHQDSRLKKKALNTECAMTKILSSEGAMSPFTLGICPLMSPPDHKDCLGALRHLLICLSHWRRSCDP